MMLVAGTFVLYLIGTVWFMVQTGNGLAGALGVCVIPFLPGDGMKIVAASVLTPAIRRGIRGAFRSPA